MAKRASKPRRGRPSLGAHGRTRSVVVRLSEIEHDAIIAAVAKENAEIKADGGDGTTATVSSWLRDHALDPLGLATYRDES